ncbi:hypothetical protein SAMN05428981_104223 [Bacillus sp. OV194]|nr:hypothetical protein SAMN05428981_104223 [Bacillus sp. OV194]
MLGGERTASTGDQGVAIIGDNNNVQIAAAPGVTNRSFLYDVCCIIADSNIKETAEYSIEKNSEWSSKMRFNKIKKYKRLFEMHAYSYGDVEEILEGFEKRETLIRHIKSIYIEYVDEDEDLPKDTILSLVKEELLRIVADCNISSGSLLTEEHKAETIYQIMFYAFTKCQLLEPIPEDERE